LTFESDKNIPSVFCDRSGRKEAPKVASALRFSTRVDIFSGGGFGGFFSSLMLGSKQYSLANIKCLFIPMIIQADIHFSEHDYIRTIKTLEKQVEELKRTLQENPDWRF
jgi:hypothetical protein